MKKLLGLLAMAGLVMLASPQPTAQALPAAKIGTAASDNGVIQVRHGHGGHRGFHGGGRHFGHRHFGGHRGFHGGGRHFGHRHHFHHCHHWHRPHYGFRPHYRPRPYYGYGPHYGRRLVCHRVWTDFGPRRVCRYRHWI